jgi:hypothetical protein
MADIVNNVLHVLHGAPLVVSIIGLAAGIVAHVPLYAFVPELSSVSMFLDWTYEKQKLHDEEGISAIAACHFRCAITRWPLAYAG